MQGRPGGLLGAAGRAEPAGDLVQRGQHLRRFQVQQRQGPYGGAQFAHRDGCPQPAAHDVADDQRRAVPGQLDDVEPVPADLGGRVPRQVPAGDVQAGRLGVPGRQQAALQYQRPLVLAAVEAGVVYADGGPGGEFHGHRPVPFPEGLAALRTGELGEPDDGVVRDHRHDERGLHEVVRSAAVDQPRPRGPQGERARRGRRVAVDLPYGDQRARTGQRGVRHGRGEGDAPQGRGGRPAGAQPGRQRGHAGPLRPGGPVVVAEQQPLVEVDGGEVAEARDGHVQQFAGGGLEVEGVPDAVPGLVEQGEIAPDPGGLAGGEVAAGDVGADARDADGAAGAAVDAVEVDGPVAVLPAAGGGAGDLEVGDGVAGLQDPPQGLGHPVGLLGREVVVDGAAAVLLDGAAEDGRETAVGPLHGEVGTEEQEAERRLAEYGLRGGEIGFDPAQRAYVDHDAQRGPLGGLGLGGHHIDLGHAVRAVAAGDPEGDEAGPFLAVEDLGHPAVPAGAQLRRHEGVHRVPAHGLCGGQPEQLLGAQAPLVDEPVGSDGEGRDLYVVIYRARRAAVPQGVVPCLPGHTGLMCLRRYLAHATVPSSSPQPDRP